MTNILTLTSAQVERLRTVGDTAVRAGNTMVRVLRDGSGYSPLIAGDGRPCPDQLVLSTTDLDVIEREPDGLVCADATRTTGWTVRVAS